MTHLNKLEKGPVGLCNELSMLPYHPFLPWAVLAAQLVQSILWTCSAQLGKGWRGIVWGDGKTQLGRTSVSRTCLALCGGRKGNEWACRENWCWEHKAILGWKEEDSKQTARVSLSNEILLSMGDLGNHSCVSSPELGRLTKVLWWPWPQ